MLEVKRLFVEKKTFCLRHISLKVEEGSSHVILGPTGCGKTTLLETLMGFCQPKEGEVYFQGKSLLKFPPHKRPFAYLPQDLALFPNMTVEENILYGARMRKYSPSLLFQKLVEVTEIRHLLGRYPCQLSSGERQRVALVRAIASGQKWLLLDEPFSALHRGMKQELWQLLKNFQKEYCLTLLLVTHDIEEAMTLGDFISILIQGEIHQQGTAEEVYTKPSTKEVAHFFGIRNLFSATVVERKSQSVLIDSPLGQFTVSTSLPLSSGEKCLLGIRKEHVHLAPPKEFPLQGKVKNITFSGAFYTLEITLPKGLSLEAALSSFSFQKLSPSVGSPLSLFLPSSHLFVLSL